MGCSRESIRIGFHFHIRQPDGNLFAHINRLNNFCLLEEFQHISVMTDNLDRLEQGLESLNIAGNLGETSRYFLL
jgi:hypothetical protein